jgi:hypothetical protein
MESAVSSAAHADQKKGALMRNAFEFLALDIFAFRVADLQRKEMIPAQYRAISQMKEKVVAGKKVAWLCKKVEDHSEICGWNWIEHESITVNGSTTTAGTKVTATLSLIKASSTALTATSASPHPKIGFLNRSAHSHASNKSSHSLPNCDLSAKIKKENSPAAEFFQAECYNAVSESIVYATASYESSIKFERQRSSIFAGATVSCVTAKSETDCVWKYVMPTSARHHHATATLTSHSSTTTSGMTTTITASSTVAASVGSTTSLVSSTKPPSSVSSTATARA